MRPHPRTLAALALVASASAGFALGRAAPRGPERPQEAFIGNDAVVEALQSDELDLADDLAVFRYVFEHLDDEVRIHPSENFYYFRFPASGQWVGGSLSLFAHNRDEGVLGFGYAIQHDKYRAPWLPLEGGGRSMGEDQGLEIHREGDLLYAVAFEGRTVRFRLGAELRSPPPGSLAPGEVHVGPAHDESGLRFFLVFVPEEETIFWVLDEAEGPAERFTRLSESLLLGDRTEFAFYDDRTHGRKILVGVEGFNVLANNWYDGPFDQMPDNLVAAGQLEVRPFLERAYPGAGGRLDRFGRYLDSDDGSRVAVAPYTVYFSLEDLAFVDFCRQSGADTPRFYACISQQRFDVPDWVGRPRFAGWGRSSEPLVP